MNINEFLALENQDSKEIIISRPAHEELPSNFWDNFCKKISQFKELEHLIFNNIPFSKLTIDSLDHLISALSSLTKLHSLDFIHNNLNLLDDVQWKKFGLLISSCLSLKNLRIAHNEIGLIPFEIWPYAIPSLFNPSIECLYLEQNALYLLHQEKWENWADKYETNVNQLNLRKIDLSGNDFHKCSTQQWTSIGYYLSKHHFLEQLNLNYNDLYLLHSEKWHHLKTFFSELPSLEYLELQGNNLFCLDDENWLSFKDALSQSNINRLNLLNNHFEDWPLVKWREDLTSLASGCYFLTDVLLEEHAEFIFIENVLQHHEKNIQYTPETVRNFDHCFLELDDNQTHVSIISTRLEAHMEHQNRLKAYVSHARKLKSFPNLTSIAMIDLDMTSEELSLWLSIFNHPLNKLDISRNPCGEESNPNKLLINELLSKNQDIQELNLSFTRFSSLSIKELAKFIVKNKTLELLDLSNITTCDNQSIHYLLASLYINDSLKICQINSSSANWLLVDLIHLIIKIKNEQPEIIPENLNDRIAFFDNHINQFIAGLNLPNEYKDEILVLPSIQESQQIQCSFKEYVLKLNGDEKNEPTGSRDINRYKPYFDAIPIRMTLPIHDNTFQIWRLTPEEIYVELNHPNHSSEINDQLLKKLIEISQKAPTNQNQVIFANAFRKLRKSEKKEHLIIYACFNRQESMTQFMFDIYIWDLSYPFVPCQGNEHLEHLYTGQFTPQGFMSNDSYHAYIQKERERFKLYQLQSVLRGADALERCLTFANIFGLYRSYKDIPPFFEKIMTFAIEKKFFNLIETLAKLGTPVFDAFKSSEVSTHELTINWTPSEQTRLIEAEIERFLTILNHAASVLDIEVLKSMRNHVRPNATTLLNYVKATKKISDQSYLEHLESLLQNYADTPYRFIDKIKNIPIDISIFQYAIKIIFYERCLYSEPSDWKVNYANLIQVLALLSGYFDNSMLKNVLYNNPFLQQFVFSIQPFNFTAYEMLENNSKSESSKYLYKLMERRLIDSFNKLKQLNIENIKIFLSLNSSNKISAILFYKLLWSLTQINSPNNHRELLHSLEICLNKGITTLDIYENDKQIILDIKKQISSSFLKIFIFSLYNDTFYFYKALQLIKKYREKENNQELNLFCQENEFPGIFFPMIFQKYIPLFLFSSLWFIRQYHKSIENNEINNGFHLCLPFFLVLIVLKKDVILKNINHLDEIDYSVKLLLIAFISSISFDIYKKPSLFHLLSAIPSTIYSLSKRDIFFGRKEEEIIVVLPQVLFFIGYFFAIILLAISLKTAIKMGALIQHEPKDIPIENLTSKFDESTKKFLIICSVLLFIDCCPKLSSLMLQYLLTISAPIFIDKFIECQGSLSYAP